MGPFTQRTSRHAVDAMAEHPVLALHNPATHTLLLRNARAEFESGSVEDAKEVRQNSVTLPKVSLRAS